MIATSPLPKSPQLSHSCGFPNPIHAYSKTLEAEAQAIRNEKRENIMFARVAGFLILELSAQCQILGSQPCSEIVQEVLSPSQDPEHDENNIIFGVGKRYLHHLIRGFRRPRASCSLPSSPRSPPCCENLEETIATLLDAPEKDSETAARKALVRDGFRCMVTGMFDRPLVEGNVELERQMESLGAVSVYLWVCHILNTPQTLGNTADETPPVSNEVPGVMGILTRFGLGELARALKVIDSVNEVWNLLSFEPNIHYFFERFGLWFEETDEPNRYTVCYAHDGVMNYVHRFSYRPETSETSTPNVVNLSPVHEGLPPPHPKLLALHAVCARVAHLSGADDFLFKLDWDAEEMEVFAYEQSSTNLLDTVTPAVDECTV